MNFYFIALLLLSSFWPIGASGDSPNDEPGVLALVRGGKPVCSLYREPGAPKSVLKAEAELQRAIKLATGTALPVITEARPPMICLGDCAAARAAGVVAEAMTDESFRIVRRGNALFIAGKDTADGKKTKRGGFSRGTLFGTYAFLERVIGVRWIMPGELGEIIPHHDQLGVPAMDVLETPTFASRQLELSDPPSVREWALRNRVGTQPDEAGGLCVDSGHSWNELIPHPDRNSHPDWAAVHAYPEESNYKFCTRNSEAVAFFTRNLIKKLDVDRERFMASASPSDGQAFCHCDRCKAHITVNLHGKESTTRNLLDFYNAVAEQTSRVHPDRMIGALFYGANEYPAAEMPKLHERLFVEWAPLDIYGLGLYKAKYREEFDRLAERWHRSAPNLGYSNYLHWHRSRGCAPLAPAPELMKLEFATLKKHGVQSVREAVDPNWAYAGPNNWMIARLMWKADADVDALYQEWLTLAYAESAGAMGRLFALLDEGFRTFKQRDEPFHYTAGQYDIDKTKISKIYLPLLPGIHMLCLEALEKVRDPGAKHRIDLFVENMKFFYHQLARAGYPLPEGISLFALSDQEFANYAASAEFPGAPPSRYYMRKAEPLPLFK